MKDKRRKMKSRELRLRFRGNVTLFDPFYTTSTCITKMWSSHDSPIYVRCERWILYSHCYSFVTTLVRLCIYNYYFAFMLSFKHQKTAISLIIFLDFSIAESMCCWKKLSFWRLKTKNQINNTNINHIHVQTYVYWIFRCSRPVWSLKKKSTIAHKSTQRKISHFFPHIPELM